MCMLADTCLFIGEASHTYEEEHQRSVRGPHVPIEHLHRPEKRNHPLRYTASRGRSVDPFTAHGRSVILRKGMTTHVMANVDALTMGCIVMSVLGLVSLYVSSKPVTLGGVVMTLLLAMSVTQAAMGMTRALGHDGSHDTPPSAAPPDVVEQMRVLWQYASTAISWRVA